MALFPIWILIALMYQIWEPFRNKLKKGFCYKNPADISLQKKIVLAISNIMQILDIQPKIAKVFFVP